MPLIEIDSKKTTKELGNLFGIFFEDINHAADGGLYAELLQNGSFEFCAVDNPAYHSLTAWEKVERGMKLQTLTRIGMPAFSQNPHYMQLHAIGTSGSAGLKNLGYHSGIYIQAGEKYRFSCYARMHDDFVGTVKVLLEDSDGTELAFEILPLLSEKWQRYEVILSPTATSYSACLLMLIQEEGYVDIDCVSLMPVTTFRNRSNGLRKDIAILLAELQPKFMRFPGGCLVPDGSPDMEARDSFYRWKHTIGPVEKRPARRNSWGYNQSLGLGYYEYFLFCEDIGTEPLPVMPVCKINGIAGPMDELQELIDDVLNLIEFANGGIEKEWGAMRASLGHPKPFEMKYVALGNEEVGAPFYELYPYFHRAIRERYPEIKIINSGSPFAASTEYDRGWRSAWENGSDYVDEHYYQAPEWFLANMDRYDDFDPDGPKVFLGEYASCSNTYYSALAEAAYMTHLEKATAVGLACYAPLLCNAAYVNWQPDLIWYNHYQVYGTANYYVQKLFMNHQGSDELAVVVSGFPEAVKPDPETISGGILLDSKKGSCRFAEITYTDNDTGEVLQFADRQTAADHLPDTIIPMVTARNYTLELTACSIGKNTDNNNYSGGLTFRIIFGYHTELDKFQWELGGWANMDSIIGHDVSGRNSCLHQTIFTVEADRTYHLKLVIRDRAIEAYIDDKLMNHTVDRQPVLQPLYYAASKDRDTNEYILKAVNVQNEPFETEIKFNNQAADSIEGMLYELAGYSLDDKNSFGEPEKIIPKEIPLNYHDTFFTHCFPAHSVSIFRLSFITHTA